MCDCLAISGIDLAPLPVNDLNVARFAANGKNKTELLSAQGLPGGMIAGFRWSSGIGCATGRAIPLRNCGFHPAMF